MPASTNSATGAGTADLDAAALSAWLEQHVAGFRGPIALTKFDGGQSNPTYRLDAASGAYVLRRKPFGTLLPSAHAVEREYRILTALYPLGFPVPRVYALCEDPAVIGPVFYLMALVDGENFTDGALPGLSKQARTIVYHGMIDALAALHRIDPQAAGLSTFGRPGNFFERQVARWIKQYRASETDRIEEVERLIAWLPATLPPQTGVSIVHGDYRIDNLIMTRSGERILAVLDWELSTLGDPLSDFSYFLMSWVTPVDRRAGLLGLDLESLGIPTLESVVARYCAKTSRDAIQDLDWYFAFNLFRLLGIAQGIKKRLIDGNASSVRAGELAGRVPQIAAQAWRHALRAGA
ncbi:MAG TPA: phosphotransferase family protein [Steroidobacteraceae bacterium]|nr:phosphotransferase family protein [Steroidobacteraceae bacterium]